MKEKLLVVGAGGFGRVTVEHAKKKYDCAFVDDGYETNTEICGVKIVGDLKDIERLFKEYKKLIVAIGNNDLREKIYRNAHIAGYEFPNIIYDNVYISPFAKVGYGCVFLNNVVIQNGSIVGNGVILNPGVEIHHDSVVGDTCLLYTNSVVRTMAKIGNRVKVGSNVTISNNVVIKDDYIVEDGMTIKE